MLTGVAGGTGVTLFAFSFPTLLARRLARHLYVAPASEASTVLDGPARWSASLLVVQDRGEWEPQIAPFHFTLHISSIEPPAHARRFHIEDGSLVVKADDFSRALTTQHTSSLNDCCIATHPPSDVNRRCAQRCH